MKPRSIAFWIALALIAAGLYLFAIEGRLLRGPLVVLAGVLVAIAGRPTRQNIVFALVTMVLAALMPIVLVAGLDLYLHHRYASTGGYNIWGYRGPALGAKRAGERRIVVLGGSTAFGYGVKTDETYPALLERALADLNRSGGPISVANLGWNGEGAFSFRFTLEDYEYLQPDLVVLYSGYNDLSRNDVVFRRQSAIFRKTGYLPILPVVSAEWLRHRDLSTSVDDKVVFQPHIADRSAAQAADLARGITEALEREVRRLSDGEGTPRAPSGVGEHCGRWQNYCRSLSDAIRFALDHGHHVVVVTEPYLAGGGDAANGQFDQQNAVRGLLTAAFPGELRVHYLNMGRAVDLTDTTLCYDGMHLTPPGNRQLASRLAAGLQPILAEMGRGTPAPSVVKEAPDPIAASIGDSPLSAQADAAVAAGQFKTARDLRARAEADARRDGRLDAAGAIAARQAMAEILASNRTPALEAARTAVALSRAPGPLWGAALVQGLAGNSGEAQSLADAFQAASGDGVATEKLWRPVLQGSIDIGRGQSQEAIDRLEGVATLERATYWPRYLRGLAHLQRREAFQAALEFSRILEQPIAAPADIVYVLAERQLARASGMRGGGLGLGPIYLKFFQSWQRADADLPLVDEVREEYVDLRRSIGLPPLPEGVWREPRRHPTP